MIRIAMIISMTIALTGCFDEGSKVIDGAKKEISRMMNDPESAKFRDTKEYKKNENLSFICGYVNGKNLFGAYSGEKRFFIARTWIDGEWKFLLKTIESTNFDAKRQREFDDWWKRECK